MMVALSPAPLIEACRGSTVSGTIVSAIARKRWRAAPFGISLLADVRISADRNFSASASFPAVSAWL